MLYVFAENSLELTAAKDKQPVQALLSKPQPSIIRLRACWVTHVPLGFAVIPPTWTRRV